MAMENVITMDRSGRLVLPVRIRKALHLSSPSAFKIEVVGDKIELTPLLPKSLKFLKKSRGILVVSTGGRKFNAVAALKIAREE